VITSLMPSSSYLPFFFHSVVAHPDLHSFPTRRSSDLAKLHRCYEQPGGCGGSAGRDDGSADNGSKRGRPGGGTGSPDAWGDRKRSEEHTSELQSRFDLVCRLLLEKKKRKKTNQ